MTPEVDRYSASDREAVMELQPTQRALLERCKAKLRGHLTWPATTESCSMPLSAA